MTEMLACSYSQFNARFLLANCKYLPGALLSLVQWKQRHLQKRNLLKDADIEIYLSRTNQKPLMKIDKYMCPTLWKKLSEINLRFDDVVTTDISWRFWQANFYLIDAP